MVDVGAAASAVTRLSLRVEDGDGDDDCCPGNANAVKCDDRSGPRIEFAAIMEINALRRGLITS